MSIGMKHHNLFIILDDSVYSLHNSLDSRFDFSSRKAASQVELESWR